MADWKPFEDGTTITTAELQESAEDLRTEANNLGASAIPLEALNRDHLPKSAEKVASAVNVNEVTQVKSFRNTFPGWPTSRMSGTGWDLTSMGGDEHHRWHVGLANSDTACPVDFTKDDGFLALANAHVSKLLWTYEDFKDDSIHVIIPEGDYDRIFTSLGAKSGKGEDGSGGGGSDSVDDGIIPEVPLEYVTGNSSHVLGFFMLVMVDSSGNYYPIPKTIRYIDGDTTTNTDKQVPEENRREREIPKTAWDPEGRECFGMPRVYKDVPIRSYIRKVDIVPYDTGIALPDTFSKVKLVASVLINTPRPTAGKPTNLYMDVKETRVSALILNMARGDSSSYRLSGLGDADVGV